MHLICEANACGHQCQKAQKATIEYQGTILPYTTQATDHSQGKALKNCLEWIWVVEYVDDEILMPTSFELLFMKLLVAQRRVNSLDP